MKTPREELKSIEKVITKALALPLFLLFIACMFLMDYGAVIFWIILAVLLGTGFFFTAPYILNHLAH
jgi:hypothetical protein